MESRHEDALRRIWEADRNWRDSGEDPRPFEVLFLGGRNEIEHPAWNPSWPIPSEGTLSDLGELGLLSINSSLVGAPFSLTRKGRSEATRMFDPRRDEEPAPPPIPTSGSGRDPRRVAVMHGRDTGARRWMYDWLRRVGLEPLEWSQLVSSTGKGSPYNGEAVEAAFRTAQAVVVLFTPDEIGALHPELIDGDGLGADERVATQPRLNVILEAGMALKSHERETILVEIGSTRPISDLAGKNTVHLSGDLDGLNELANRLEGAGCEVRRGDEWHRTEELQRLPALRRTADAGDVPGGLSPVTSGAFYALLRARGTRIEFRVRDDGGWGDWTLVGSVDEKPVGIACASVGSVHAEVFALLPRGEVKHNWRLRGNWQAHFQSLGRPFGDAAVKRISAGSMRKGHQEVFVESAAGEIAHLWMDGSWHRNADPATSLGDGWWRF